MLTKKLEDITTKVAKNKELTETQESLREDIDNLLEDYWYEIAYGGLGGHLNKFFEEPFLTEVKSAVATLKSAFSLLEKVTGDYE